jgi:hypothetical protein
LSDDIFTISRHTKGCESTLGEDFVTITAQTVSNNKPRPVWQLFFGIIDQPVATFRAIASQPTWSMWAAPLVGLILCFAVFIIVQTPYNLELAREQMESQLASLPAEQGEAARAGMEMTMTIPFMLATGLGFGVIALLLGILAQAVFLYFSALVSGGEMSFGAVFRMSAWTSMPFAIGFLAQAGFMAFAQRMIQYPGLAYLAATGELMQDARNPLFGLLGRIDLFWLWHMLLVMLGLSVVARFGRGKSLALTVVYAGLSLGLTVLPTLLFGGMMGG